MNPDVAIRMIRSCEAMERQIQILIDRHSGPSALAAGTRRALGDMGNGILAFRNVLQNEVSLIMSGFVDVEPRERPALDRLTYLLADPANRLLAWNTLGEKLAAEGHTDARGRAYTKDRLIKLALAAAGGKRYAYGVPTTSRVPGAEPEGQIFDLLNLPNKVGGRGGLGPIVRACYDGCVKYDMTWRFATPQDCVVAASTVDDTDDEDDDSSEAASTT